MSARLFAFLIDVALLSCASFLMTGSIVAGHLVGADRVTFKDPIVATIGILFVFFVSHLFLFLSYFTYLGAQGEMTVGKSIFKLKVVRRRDEESIGWGRAFVRACAYFLSAFPFFLGFFVAFLLRGRALHDILAGTKVVTEE